MSLINPITQSDARAGESCSFSVAKEIPLEEVMRTEEATQIDQERRFLSVSALTLKCLKQCSLICAGVVLPVFLDSRIAIATVPALVVPGLWNMFHSLKSLCNIWRDPSESSACRITILTGEVEEVNLRSTSQKLRENLDFAKQIISHVNQIVLFSANYPKRSDVIRSISDQTDLHNKIGAITCATRMVQEIDDEMGATENRAYEIIAAHSEKYNVGNCFEMSAVGYMYAKQLNEDRLINGKEKILVSIFTIVGGNHLFLAVEGNEQFNFGGKNFPPDLVFCDPWSKSFYPAEKCASYLRDYVGMIDHTEGRYTLVKPFEPSYQTLKKETGFSLSLPRRLWEVVRDFFPIH